LWGPSVECNENTNPAGPGFRPAGGVRDKTALNCTEIMQSDSGVLKTWAVIRIDLIFWATLCVYV